MGSAGGRVAPTLRVLLLGGGPRFARDALGPVLVFYLGWKTVGLGAGVAAATLVAGVVYAWERRRRRAGLSAAIGLAIALAQALTGLLSGSPILYFVPPVVVNALWGLAFLVSAAIGRPLAGVFARETYPFREEVATSATFRRVFARVSVAWGLYFVARSAVRLLVLSRGHVELYIVVNVLTGLPFTAALTAWSLWYGLRSFRRSAEWGWALESPRDAD